MGYRHIDLEERCATACLRKRRRSIREIAATPDLSPPTVSRRDQPQPAHHRTSRIRAFVPSRFIMTTTFIPL